MPLVLDAANQDNETTSGDVISETMHILSPNPKELPSDASIATFGGIWSVHASPGSPVADCLPGAASASNESESPVLEVDGVDPSMHGDPSLGSKAGDFYAADTELSSVDVCNYSVAARQASRPCSPTCPLDFDLELLSDNPRVSSDPVSFSAASNQCMEGDTDVIPEDPLSASQSDEDRQTALMSAEFSSSPMPSSSPPPIFSSSPPAWDRSTPPSSSPPTYKNSDEESLDVIKDNVAFVAEESIAESSQEVALSDDPIQVPSSRSYDSVAKRAVRDLALSIESKR